MSKKQSLKLYHQGDVLLVRIPAGVFEEAAKDAKVNPKGVLQWGEATGHAHKIRGQDLQSGRGCVLEMPQPRSLVNDVPRPVASKTLLEVTKELTIEHGSLTGGKGDHDSIKVGPGRYAVLIQQEGDDEYRQQVRD